MVRLRRSLPHTPHARADPARSWERVKADNARSEFYSAENWTKGDLTRIVPKTGVPYTARARAVAARGFDRV